MLRAAALLLLAPLAAAQAPPAADGSPSAPPPAGDSAPAPLPEPVRLERLRRELHHADTLLLQGRPDAALGSLQFITSVVPGHAGAWLLTSRALSDLGRTADARDAAERAVSLLEKDPPERREAWGPAAFYSQLGRARIAAGELPLGEQALRRADREQPDDAAILRELGSVLLRQGRDAEAAATLRRAVTLDPKSSRAHVELGNALMHLGDVVNAQAAFAAATALAPEEPEPHYGLAQVATDEATKSRELAEFERLQGIRDERAAGARRVDDALRRAAGALEKHRAEGGGSFAGDAVEAARAGLAEPVVAETNYHRKDLLLLLARAHEAAGEWMPAREAYERAAEADPRDPTPELELGGFLAGRGLIDEAFPHLLRAAELSPLDPAPHASLGLEWAALGNIDAALAETAKASLLEPNDRRLRQQYVDLLASSGRVKEAADLAKAGGVDVPMELAPEAAAPAPPEGPPSVRGATVQPEVHEVEP